MTMTEDANLLNRLLGMTTAELLADARAARLLRPRRMTYSPKVFIPLTKLCADVCAYCTFATTPSQTHAPFLDLDQVLEIARKGQATGCKEALFTLGDAPERRYSAARTWLAEHDFSRTIDYVRHCAEAVVNETGLLPHINAGVLDEADYLMLRPVAASFGLMLESASDRLCQKGGPHYGSPDKAPDRRIASLEAAGRTNSAMTSGILVGIGETEQERIEALFVLRNVHRTYKNIQEVIVQNFCPKPRTRMSLADPPTPEAYQRAIAMARIILPPDVSIQVPPNLNGGRIADLIETGLDDWGGISPVTVDHVNPEAPWPQIDRLSQICAAAGHPLVERLTAHPRFIIDGQRGWIDASLRPAVLKLSDAEGLAREGVWSPGMITLPPGSSAQPLGHVHAGPVAPALDAILGRAAAGYELSEDEITTLFASRGADAGAVVEAADDLRRSAIGNTVTFVANRNINYTNICTHACTFCAFSKTSSKGGFRDKPYDLKLEEIAERAREAFACGATEVCLQGGIHPSYTGKTYRDILRAVKRACPQIHVHAFSPLEVSQGACTLGMPPRDYLAMLKDEGLGSLPGTAAEILDDDVRRHICPDKLSTQQWLDIVRAAHEIGLPTTSTIMFGHMEQPIHWARHLLALRRLQTETGGFTEFVPLPFVHMEAPSYRRGQSRRGPTWREAVLMHAVSRIVLFGHIASIQCSWVKLGLAGAGAVLGAGANDLGGILMNESISRAAGANHGQAVEREDLEAVAAAAGRTLQQRTTLYQAAAIHDVMA